MVPIEPQRPWLFQKITEIISNNIGRFIHEVGDNNYSAITSMVVLNMTQYMYKNATLLPGVPTPLGLNM